VLVVGFVLRVVLKDAISFLWGKAEIDQRRCVYCGLCVKICPQGAIVERVVISPKALETEVQSLQTQVEDILGRLDRLTGVK
jgi:Fe-S-cluster-containing hydrogenase component 2